MIEFAKIIVYDLRETFNLCFSVSNGKLPGTDTNKTSRKWYKVAIFRKWQDSSVALWIEIVVILNWS